MTDILIDGLTKSVINFPESEDKNDTLSYFHAIVPQKKGACRGET